MQPKQLKLTWKNKNNGSSILIDLYKNPRYFDGIGYIDLNNGNPPIKVLPSEEFPITDDHEKAIEGFMFDMFWVLQNTKTAAPVLSEELDFFIDKFHTVGTYDESEIFEETEDDIIDRMISELAGILTPGKACIPVTKENCTNIMKDQKRTTEQVPAAPILKPVLTIEHEKPIIENAIPPMAVAVGNQMDLF